MKRRNFGFLTGCSMIGLGLRSRHAYAQAADPHQLLSTTLTPLGSERAGNAAGTIPAWTGGFTEMPSDWNPATQIVPDFWAHETPRLVVDSSNMAQYSDNLSEGVKHLIQNSGLSLKIYQTHRTATLPQYVYDNIVKNATSAQLDPNGGRLGFLNAYGGTPFPIPDTSDPLAAGAQIIWNHETRWDGYAYNAQIQAWAVSNGSPVMAARGDLHYLYPYYDPNGSLETFNGILQDAHVNVTAPASQIGGGLVAHYYTDPLKNPNIIWQLIEGEGRVRKAPELQYDTPSGHQDGIINVDEENGFYGALNEYDWKFIAKKEIFIPYNNNAMRRAMPLDVMGQKFLNPDVIRWELHRVWVVEANLHPGERNVLARRRMYVDEDTWTIMLADSWDAGNNLYKEDMTFNYVMPNLPGTILLNSVGYNLQTGDYATINGPMGNDGPENFVPMPPSYFEPQSMAASASY
jgi:hypothetical protein